VLMNATMSSVEMAGADLQGTLTNAQAGHALRTLGRPLEELVGLHQLWVQTFGAEGKQLDLSGFDLRTATELSRGSLPMLRASRAVFFGLDLDGAGLQAAQLDGADLRSCRLARVDLRGVNLERAQLNFADLRDCNLAPLVVAEGRLMSSRLADAELCHADLRGADLQRADCRGADFSSANLTGARRAGSDFSGAITEGALGLATGSPGED
jgi:uncharacterized protein YjbI with pentapeptide repeats